MIEEYEEFEEEVDNFSCKDCRHCNAECKNIERTFDAKIKVDVPWFVCMAGQLEAGTVCCKFEPKTYKKYACEHWKGFEHFLPLYEKQWHKFGENELIWLVYSDNKDVQYGVPIKEWIYGHPVKDGVIQAVKKRYLKRDKVDLGIQLYKTVYEDI